MPNTSENQLAAIQTPCLPSSAPSIVNTSLHRKGQRRRGCQRRGLSTPGLNVLPLSTPDMHLVEPGAATFDLDT